MGTCFNISVFKLLVELMTDFGPFKLFDNKTAIKTGRANPKMSYVLPVSYTHLDVYKRQVVYRPPLIF